MTAEKTNSAEQSAESREVKENLSKEEKFDEIKEKITNILFSILIVVTLMGSLKMFYLIEDFRKPLIEHNPTYNFPNYNHIFQAVSWIPLMAVK